MNNAIGAQTPEGRMYDAIEHAKQPTATLQLSRNERKMIDLLRRLPKLDQKALLQQAQEWVNLYKARAHGKKA